MKKISTVLAALAVFASAQAAVTVTLADGTPVGNGETITRTASDFNHVVIPDFKDDWESEVSIVVKGTAPTKVELESNYNVFQFCPLGEGCYNFFQDGDKFVSEGTLLNNTTNIPVHAVFSDVAAVPAQVSTLKCTLTDASGDVFSMNFVFDTTDSGVAEIAGEAESYDVYSVAGVRVLKGAHAEALEQLPAGLYIVNGKKVLVK